MTRQLEEDNYLTIHLIMYDRPSGSTERYYFADMSTQQATILLSHDRKITSSKILAYTSDNKYVETIPNIDTVADLNGFIIKNSDYDIVNCEVEFDNGTILSSHDDAEISIQLLDNSTDQNFINDIFEKYNLDKRLIETLKNNLGHYIAIDKLNNIVRVYETFDDYVENRRD